MVIIMTEQYQCTFKLMSPDGKLSEFSGKLLNRELRVVVDTRRFNGCHVLRLDVKPLGRERPDIQRLGMLICGLSAVSVIALIARLITH